MNLERSRQGFQSDEQLLARSRRGDAAAFGALTKRHWSAIYRLAWNMLANAGGAARASEAAMLAAVARDDAFPRDVSFVVSLYRLALGESWRRLHAQPVEAEHGVRKALQELPALDRAAFLLREIEQLPLGEAAAVLGIPEESIVERAHRSTLVLAAVIGGDERAPLRRAG